MSIRVMSRVWEEAPVSGGRLLVLLALADFSNEDGMSWPSVQTLARKARLKERQTQQVLNDLENVGLITRQFRAGMHGVTHYWITLPLVGGAEIAGVQS